MPTRIDPTYIKSPFISPEDFLKKLKEMPQDPEYFHINSDDAMADLLRAMGYGEAIDYIEDHERWYS